MINAPRILCRYFVGILCSNRPARIPPIIPPIRYGNASLMGRVPVMISVHTDTRQIGRIIETEQGNTGCFSRVVLFVRIGTSIRPPPEPNKPLTTPASPPAIMHVRRFFIKKHHLRLIFPQVVFLFDHEIVFIKTSRTYTVREENIKPWSDRC